MRLSKVSVLFYDMFYIVYSSDKVVFSVGFLIGVVLACLWSKTENEPSLNLSCEARDGEQSYQSWLVSMNIQTEPVDYESVAYGKNEDNVSISEASYLRQKVPVLCIVFVSKAKNMVAIKDTWGKHCEDVIFFGKKNMTVNIPVIQFQPKSAWEYLCDAFIYISHNKLQTFHWVLVVPDEVYAIPENIRYFVASLDSARPYYLGHPVTFWGQTYNDAEAGYLLSRGAIQLLHKKFNSSDACRNSGKYWRNEDFYLGKYLAELGVNPGNTRDLVGCSRFHRYNLNYILGPPILKTSSVPTRHKEKLAAGEVNEDCYSNFTITFNGLESDKFYLYYYLLYHIKVLQHGGLLGNHPPSQGLSEDEVWQEFLREEGVHDVTDISPNQYFELWERKIAAPDVVNSMLRHHSRNYNTAVESDLHATKRSESADVH